MSLCFLRVVAPAKNIYSTSTTIFAVYLSLGVKLRDGFIPSYVTSRVTEKGMKNGETARSDESHGASSGTSSAYN